MKMSVNVTRTWEILYLLLCFQCFVPVVRTCISSSDCSGILQKCCYGSCTERDNCQGTCSSDYNCDLSEGENCCNGYCQSSSCYDDNAGVVIGLSVAGTFALVVGIVICVGCACRTRRTPGRVVNRRVVNRRVVRTTTTTRRVPVAANQPLPGYQNPGYPNQGYQEFPQPPQYQPVQAQAYRNYQPPTTGGYQRETFQAAGTGGACVGVAPPPYSEVAGGGKGTLYAPQQSYGAVGANSTQPSAPPPQ